MKRKELLDRITGLIDDYLEKNDSPETKVVEYKDPKELSAILSSKNFESGSFESLIQAIKTYLKYSVRTGHKQYFNQLWAGYSMPALLGEIFAALSNTSMYTYEVAPAATLLERELTEKMCSLLGFRQGEGLLVTGGSNANLIAMLCARNEKMGNVMAKGLTGGKRPVIFISDQAHYSFFKGANICGIGMDNVVKISSDDNGRMIPNELEKAIIKCTQQGDLPLFVAATAGTTVLNAFDPIDEIAKIAQKNGIWFHVDGALGGSAVFSAKHRHLLSGIEKADSVAWNPHKMLGLPLICSAILIRQKGRLLSMSHSEDIDAQYIFHHEENSGYDLGPKSLQCGRRVDSLKLWLAWLFYGEQGFEKRVDRLFDLAAYAEERISSEKKLKLMAPRQALSVCFRYVPDAEQDLNSFNVTLREKLYREGLSMVNYATIGKNKVIRLVTMNPELSREDMDIFFANLAKIGQEMEFNPLNY